LLKARRLSYAVTFDRFSHPRQREGDALSPRAIWISGKRRGEF